MNYAQYLQVGGAIDQAPAQDELSQIVEAFKLNPEEVLSQLGEKAPEFLKEMMQVAEQTQDQELGELVQSVAQQIGLMKCGGKVRAKVKKACGGRKMEAGAKVPMDKKGALCGCTTYKKVGGRIVEVDCNDIPTGLQGMKIFRNTVNALNTTPSMFSGLFNKPVEVPIGQTPEVVIEESIPEIQIPRNRYKSVINYSKAPYNTDVNYTVIAPPKTELSYGLTTPQTHFKMNPPVFVKNPTIYR